MPNRKELLHGKRADPARMELEMAQHVGAVILLVAGAGFLQLAFALDRVFDLSRLAY